MPVPCAQTDSAYFMIARERAACKRYDVPAGTSTRCQLHDAVVAARLPAYSLLIPDICNDRHDCSLHVSDRWLRQWCWE